ncbi:MAG: fumarate reductase (quinol) flavoprotein subunit [Betaproteobacteria bacterium RIFCSPLOWO2_12_FULL_65_14]|nr:MAG: fumarate reductase (quinol) flavoprotein subunit [Betaproteobacteria bacterium RIFCSPLOWO2_12_FULL_65_14]
MQIIQSDVVIVGGGGAGLRAAIAASERDSRLRVALVSKVVPMRSHTVAAEGGAAAVTRTDDSLQYHFDDTVAGGDWLCDQSVVEYFVAHSHEELVRLEHWGCPWGRQPDGHINVRYFGGMKVPRTWYAADRSGFHILHTLFQTSHKYPGIKRYDEYFCVELLVDDGHLRGVLAIEIATGEFVVFEAPSVVLATGGVGRVFRQNTNAGTVTGDGMGLAFRAGVPLRDMEFMQYHPTCLPGTGILMTEACRGEGAVLTNKDGYRYLQDYGLGPIDPWPRPKAMELGPRDRLSQAFWHEMKKGRTFMTPGGPAVNLDLRHLGAKRIHERLPLIAEAAKTFSGVDAVKEPIPVCPAVHYMMGGILTNVRCETTLPGLYAAGECASVGIHGANRLGSNSLTELVVFGRVAGEQAAQFALAAPRRAGSVLRQAQPVADRLLAMLNTEKGERLATVRDEMRLSMEAGAGIYRKQETLQETCRKLVELRGRYRNGIRLDDRGRAFNTEWLTAIELRNMLEVAQAIAHSALERRESRGAHQRLDHETRDDENFLKHSLACSRGEEEPRIEYMPVTITKSSPRARVYGGEGKQVVLT